MADYTQALAALHALGAELGTHRKFELEHMRVLARAVGDPQAQFPSVLVAGTNGKGSTCATLAAILQASGYKTGLYTSPHLSRVNERMRVNGAEIADDAFASAFTTVDEAARVLVAGGELPGMPSFFETVTAMAFVYLAHERVDIAVLEVGLGGRLDATNIVQPEVSVITDIALDHTAWLGPTLTHIAREKAGILRHGGVMVTLPQHSEVNQALGEVAVPLEVEGVSAARYVRPASREPAWSNRYPLEVLGEEIEVNSPLKGEHQTRNIALAIAAAVALHRQDVRWNGITPGSIAAGIAATEWPGRLERMDNGRVLLDVAHNPAGAWSLRAALSALERETGVDVEKAALVFACLDDKAAEEMAQILFPLFARVIVTQVDSPRAIPAQTLADRTGGYARSVLVKKDPMLALATAMDGGFCVVAGSVYLVGQLRPALPVDGGKLSLPNIAGGA